ncbi:MAG: DUF3467 domain-containing protein [Acidobacteria bacterium]|nr:DUF3467 domain-containing protein [Acidobacteriota bacterium]
MYCNYFNVNWSLYDVRIQFGQLIPDDQQKEVVALENASVTMSWHEAKLFKDFLANAIERFEKANYELKHLNPIL